MEFLVVLLSCLFFNKTYIQVVTKSGIRYIRRGVSDETEHIKFLDFICVLFFFSSAPELDSIGPDWYLEGNSR